MTYTTAYQYDDGDHISQMTLPSGRVIDYQRDGVRRITRIDTTLNGIAQNIVRNIQYRGDHQMQQCTFGNDLTDTRSYDLQGRLLSQLLEDASNQIIDQRSYSYDKNSNILNIDTNVEDNAYSYDKLDRILSDAIDATSPYDFTYDLNDNRLTKLRQDNSLDAFYAFQPDTNRINLLETAEFGSTPLTDTPNRDLVYNDVGRLFQLIEDGSLTAEYLYNDAGQRTRKTTYQADGITVDRITIYHYDQMDYLISETTETGVLIKDYIWQEGMTPLAQIDANPTTETIVYLHTDHLMTNRLATDEFQTVAWRWEGEAFGNTPAQELAGISVNLRFPGQYYDQETNLHYNYMRYYDPSLGRYITSDPVGLEGGANTYLYAEANPIVFIDPSGETPAHAVVFIAGVAWKAYKFYKKMPCYVYELRDCKGKRVYIGISKAPPVRMYGHRSSRGVIGKFGCDGSCPVTMHVRPKGYKTRKACLAEEKKLISRHKPIWNTQGNSDPGKDRKREQWREKNCNC